jgi:hypothetical protein
LKVTQVPAEPPEPLLWQGVGSKFVPVIVTGVSAWPIVGVKLEMDGAPGVDTVKVEPVAVPDGDVTEIVPVVAEDGTVATI